jgi:regulatory protein
MPLRSPPKKPLEPDRADPAAIRVAAVTLLARRDFASAQLRTKLVDRGFAEDAVRTVLAELGAAGLLSEARYVEHYVSAHAHRGQGPVRIGADLRKHGVPEALIGPALEAVDWVELARKVRHGRFGANPPQNWADKARQARFLQYRGFSADHIRSATGADPDFE